MTDTSADAADIARWVAELGLAAQWDATCGTQRA
jgi:hypothetical protein